MSGNDPSLARAGFAGRHTDRDGAGGQPVHHSLGWEQTLFPYERADECARLPDGARRVLDHMTRDVGMMTRLAELPVGSSARVANVGGASDGSVDEVTLRLLEMGLTPGATVSIVGSAPLGDPLELELRGYRLSVRRSEAARVEVEVSK